MVSFALTFTPRGLKDLVWLVSQETFGDNLTQFDIFMMVLHIKIAKILFGKFCAEKKPLGVFHFPLVVGGLSVVFWLFCPKGAGLNLGGFGSGGLSVGSFSRTLQKGGDALPLDAHIKQSPPPPGCWHPGLYLPTWPHRELTYPSPTPTGIQLTVVAPFW